MRELVGTSLPFLFLPFGRISCLHCSLFATSPHPLADRSVFFCKAAWQHKIDCGVFGDTSC